LHAAPSHPPSAGDSQALAKELGVSREAVELVRACRLLDLHVEPYLTHRLWGSDLQSGESGLPWAGRFFGHLNFEDIRLSGLAGAMWSITTQPFSAAHSRWDALRENLGCLQELLRTAPFPTRVVRTHSELVAAFESGAHAAMVSIQGGNAVEGAPRGGASLVDTPVVRVTLVHLTNSVYGVTSSPLALWRAGGGLTARGRELVEQLNTARIFVDLAHINERGFWDAVEVHDRSQPLLVTHTGLSACTPSWRNITDAQLKAVADTGGTTGIIFAHQFIRPPRSAGRLTGAQWVARHVVHACRVVGPEFVSLGSDYDGAITPPADLRRGVAYARVVQALLDAGLSATDVERVASKNFLRAFQMLRS
jgi:membrane dipeptidase